MKCKPVDKTQLKRHLSFLGQGMSRCYLRFFFEKHDKRKDGDKGRKLNRCNWDVIPQYQYDGRGVHFVVNGGGHKNADITEGKAFFIEHDDISKDRQKIIWKEFNLPEPTFQVDSGRRSIHSYWVLRSPVSLDSWRQLQKDLIAYTKADKELASPSHCMRLAGCYRLLEDGSFSLVKIISQGGKRYGFEEIRKAVPVQSTSNSPIRQLEIKDAPSVPKLSSIPMLSCCSLRVRGLISSGVEQGDGRNQAFKEVVAELIGVEQWLIADGQAYTGTAEQLFKEYCDRSGMTQAEFKERWDWARGRNYTPSLDENKLRNCINAEIRKQQPSESNRLNPKPGKKNDALSAEQTIKKLEELANTQFDSEAEKQLAYQKVADKSILSEFKLRQLIKDLSTVTLTSSEARRLDSIITASTQELDYWKVIPELAADILADAENANCDPALFLFPLLAATLSLAGTNTYLRQGSYDVPPNLFAIAVAPVSAGKSRGQRAIDNGIEPIDKAFKEAHEKELEEFEEELRYWEESKNGPKPKRPTRQRLQFSRATPEAVTKHGNNQVNHGAFWARDEIAGILRNASGYSNNNDGLQSLLELWDKTTFNLIRVREDDCADVEMSLNLYGGIQPNALGEFLSDQHTACGLIARFIFVRCHRVRLIKPPELKPSALKDKLEGLFRFVFNHYNHEMKLSEDAVKLYGDYCLKIDQEASRYSEDSPEAGWMLKANGQLCRIAMALNMIASYFDDSRNREYIGADIIERAIIFIEFSKYQFLSVINEFYFKNDGNLGDLLGKLWYKAKLEVDGLTLRSAVQTIPAIRFMAKDEGFETPLKFALHLFREISKAGKAQLRKQGRNYTLHIIEEKKRRVSDGFEPGESVHILPSGCEGKILERHITDDGDKIALTDQDGEYYFLTDMRPNDSKHKALCELIKEAVKKDNQVRFDKLLEQDADFVFYWVKRLGEEYEDKAMRLLDG